MLQVFDEIRAILQKYKEKMPVVTTAEILASVDEAEAKWGKDCCVWEYRNPASYAEAHGFWEFHDNVKGWKFCPYCGKPIKIVEVE